MTAIVLFIAMSLDGYIADRSGGVAFLQGDGSAPDHPGSYPEFIQTVDTVLLGYTTYHQLVTELSPDEWPYEGKTCYVFTHRTLPNAPGVIFTAEDPAALVRRLRSGDGQTVWVCGGAAIVQALMNEDLIDRYHITVIPVALGGGIRLFGERDAALPLRLMGTQAYNGMVDLVYERRR